MEGCPCLLPNAEALEAHVWMHNTLKTKPPYPCFEEGCSQVYDTKHGILAHSLTHLTITTTPAASSTSTVAAES